MFDFKACPVVDNHCHVLEPEKETLTQSGLRGNFSTALPTSYPGRGQGQALGATDDLLFHFPHMGVVLTAVCQLSKLFGCSAELEAVAAERNRRTGEAGLAGYAKMLYDDAGIVASVMDSGLPVNDPSSTSPQAGSCACFRWTPSSRNSWRHAAPIPNSSGASRTASNGPFDGTALWASSHTRANSLASAPRRWKRTRPSGSTPLPGWRR